MSVKECARFDFGPIASQYDSWYDTPAGRMHDQHQKALVRKFLPRPRTGSCLLDVGCGTGHWSAFFSSMGFNVTGVDISPEMVEIARLKGIARCKFELADAYHLLFDDGTFEIITAMAMLEFVDDPEMIIFEMTRCLKSRGSIIIGTLNKLSPLNRRRIAQGAEPYASAHLYSPKELRSFLTKYGRVRLDVSSERNSNRESDFLGMLWRRAALRKERPTGAFIVAEVSPWKVPPWLHSTAISAPILDPVALFVR